LARTIRTLLPLFALAAVIAAAYGPSLRGGFVWDDRPLIVDNHLVREKGSLATLLTSGFWQTGDRHDRFRSFFRPAVSLTYAVDYALWGLRPVGFRLTNLFLHLLCCWLVYRLAMGEGLGPRASLVGAALFAAHPVHVESVAWISGRTDLVCAAFFLGAFLAYRKAIASESRRLAWRGLSLSLFLLALFSKEMAATLPLLVGLDAGLRTRGGRRGARAGLFAALPYLAVLALYLPLRHLALGTEAEPLYRLGWLSHVATAIFVLARYATLLILPVGLDAHYPYRAIETLRSPLVLVSVPLLGVVAWLGVRLRRRDPGSCFWLLWIGAGLVPVLAFGKFGDILLADRFLYLPSAGLCVLAARLVAPALRDGAVRFGRAIVAGAAALIVILFVAQSGLRAEAWKDDLTLFSGMAKTSPASAMVRSNLGLAYYQRGDYARAIDEFDLSISLVSGYALAFNNKAAALERTGRYREALDQYEQALRIAPSQAEARINAGSLLVRLGETGEGLDRLSAVARDYPRYPAALYAYANALDTVGRRDEAIPYLERAMEIDPFYPNSYYLVGKIFLERGDGAGAAASMRRFLELWTEPGLHADAARRVIARADSGEAGSAPIRPVEPGPSATESDPGRRR
jgi:protein O-mannosyl-transferase